MICVKEVFIVIGLFSYSSVGNPIQQTEVYDYSAKFKTVEDRIDSLAANLSYILRIQKDLLGQLNADKKLLEQLPDENQKYGATKVDSYLLKRVYRQLEPDQVAFTAKLNNKLENIPIGTTVLFDYLVYSTDSSYDPTTGVFTCPTSGLYLFSVFVESATHREALVVIKKDGVEITYAISEPSVTGEDDSGGNLVLASVTKGSRVWVETHNVDQQSFWPTFTTFSGVLIHRYRD